MDLLFSIYVSMYKKNIGKNIGPRITFFPVGVISMGY